MEKRTIIPAEECCNHYNIELSFVRSLDDHGLLSVTDENQQLFIAADELPVLERYMRLYYELQINFEGLEAISHLLERITALQQNLAALQHREAGL